MLQCNEIYIGIINKETLDIKANIFSQIIRTHHDLRKKYNIFSWSSIADDFLWKDFRYRKDLNVVFYKEDLSKSEKESILNWIKQNIGPNTYQTKFVNISSNVNFLRFAHGVE